MATDEQAQRQKSPIDFANSGIQLAQNARKAQRIVSAIQKAKKIQAAAALIIANWEIVAIGIIVIVIVALFLVIITTIMGNSHGGAPLPSPQPGPPPTQGQTLTCPDGDYVSCLRQDFNIVVRNGTADQLAKIFQSFAFVGQSSNYVSLLKSGGHTLQIVITNTPTCSAYTRGSAGIINFPAICLTYKFSTYRYLLTHESGHIINARNLRLFQSFPWTQYQAMDSSCYDRGLVKSYPLRPVSSGVQKQESFAEAIADALTITSTNKTGFLFALTINNYPNQCSATYSWATNNVFGNGVRFY